MDDKKLRLQSEKASDMMARNEVTEFLNKKGIAAED